MSCRSTLKVIVPAPYESLPSGCEHRLLSPRSRLRSGVTLRDLIEREGEGSGRSLRGSQGCYQEGSRKGPGQNAESHTFAM